MAAGSQIFVAFGKEQKDHLWVCINKGRATIEAHGQAVAIANYQGVAVLSNRITRPKMIEFTRKINWLMNPNKGEINDFTVVDENYQLLEEDYD